MTRAVFDANVLASGLSGLSRESLAAPAALLRLWILGRFTLIISAPLLHELEEHAFADPYFRRILSEEARQRAFTRLRSEAVITELTVTVQGVAPDPDDDHVLAAAASSAADYLVTGDRALRGVGSYQGITIVTPREFVDILEPDERA